MSCSKRLLALLVVLALWAMPASAQIARNATADLATQNPVSTYTAAYTVGSGANRLLVAGFFGDTAADVITGVTYAGVAMTAVTAGLHAGSDRFVYLYYLLAPTSGSNNLVITASSAIAIRAQVADYTGVKQSAQPDAFGSASATSASGVSKALTVVAANSWAVAIHREDAGSPDTWTNMTELQSSSGGGLHLADTNGALATGAITFTAATGGAFDQAMIVASFSPSGGAAAVPCHRSLMGVGCDQ